MKQTTLDLNGPILSFTTHPQNVLVNNAGIATFVGIATATFPTQTPANPATGTGDISYRWYAEGIGALSDGINTTIEATLSGTATTTLTVTSPTKSGIQFFVSADYIPSAYQSSSPVTAGTGRSTGNAINDILFSNNATLIVNPTISISRQPSSSTVAQGQTATFSVTAASSNNTNVQYQWYIGGFPVGNGTYGAGWMDGNTISGATTNTLTVTTSSKTSVGTLNVYVSVSHPTAGNSPVTSNTVIFEVVSPRAIINFESFGSSNTAILNSINFNNASVTYSINTTTLGNVILGFYAPEKDVNLELEIFASKGLDSGFGYSGGQGGYSKIRFTVKQNEEYIIAPLPQQNQNGGVFIYHKAALIASVGSGGDAGSDGDGGDGGGVGVGGASGLGRGEGRGGGVPFSAGRLPSIGIFGSNTGQEPYAGTGDTKASAPNGGRVLPCPRGKYWRDEGFSPCEILADIEYFTADGLKVTNSAVILRAYKPGYDIRQTAGRGLSGGGNGGEGATGGQGGVDGGGGGGGSGYTDGSVTVVSTQQGGSTENAKVIFRTF